MRNDDIAFSDSVAFARALATLRQSRKQRVTSDRTSRANRMSLTRAERDEVLRKSAGRCHLCGGAIEGSDWQADHVLAHSSGGAHDLANYLAAHSVCNNYRWHYDAEEFQWILKLGVWLRTQIERQTAIGRDAGEQFCAYERRRASRRKTNATG